MGGGIFWIVGVGGHFLWVNGGRWRYIFGEWGWVDFFWGGGGGGVGIFWVDGCVWNFLWVGLGDWRYILGG